MEMYRVTYSKFWREIASIAFALAVILQGSCSYYSETFQSPGIAEGAILNRAFREAREASDIAVAEFVSQRQVSSDVNMTIAAQSNLAAATEVADRFYSRLRKAYNSESARGALMRRAGEVKVSLTIVVSPSAFAKAFPGGQIIVSDTLILALLQDTNLPSPALIGVLLHELIHVRHGHAAQQWMTSDGRIRFLQDQAASGLASLVSLIPGLSIKYNVGYYEQFALPDKLPILSEYAADLGTIFLLEHAGIDARPYEDYLRSILVHTKRSDSNFELLAGRVKCIGEGRGIATTGVTALVLGDPDLKKSKSVSYQRHEDAERDLTSSDLSEVASARSFLYLTCAVRVGLRDLVTSKNRAIYAPYFDDGMFTEFYYVLWRIPDEQQKP